MVCLGEEAVGLFAFDGCTSALDVSGHDSIGEKSQVDYTSGPEGGFAGALQIDSTPGSYIKINASSAMDTKYSFSILVHFKAEGSGSLLYQTDGCHLVINSTHLLFSVNSLVGESVTITHDISYNEWYYIGAEYDYNTNKAMLYVSKNGAAFSVIAEDASFTDNINTAGDIMIGGDFMESGYFSGSVSCLQVYNRALLEDEITAKRKCPAGITSDLPGKQHNYVHYKRFILPKKLPRNLLKVLCQYFIVYNILTLLNYSKYNSSC